MIPKVRYGLHVQLVSPLTLNSTWFSSRDTTVGCVLGAAHLLSADVAEKMAVICDVESGTGNYESYESDCPCLLAGWCFF